MAFTIVGFNPISGTTEVAAQIIVGSRNSDTIKPEKFNGSDSETSYGDLEVVESSPINVPYSFRVFAPEAVAANSIYSNVTNFLGSGYINGGGSGTTVKTVLVADDLTVVGTAPISVTGFRFSMANFNGTALSVRPTIYFYQANGANGGPGTLIASFAFTPVTVSAGSVTLLSATNAPFTLPATSFWAGIAFDRGGTSTATTNAQLNNFGQGFYNPVDRGSSADNIFVSTASATGANNPAGSQGAVTGVVSNFGWEILAATTVLSINRADAESQISGASANFTVTFNTPVSGLTASNFALATTGTIAGATVTAVTPVGTTPTQTYTVTVSFGSGTGTVGLNLVNFTGLNTTGTNTPPVVGQTYTVTGTAPTATNVTIEGRVYTNKGGGLRNALVTLTDRQGNTQTILSGISGTFRFANLPAGETFIISVRSKTYQFVPQIINPMENLSGLEFFPSSF